MNLPTKEYRVVYLQAKYRSKRWTNRDNNNNNNNSNLESALWSQLEVTGLWQTGLATCRDKCWINVGLESEPLSLPFKSL